jgi:hypothetical protein
MKESNLTLEHIFWFTLLRKYLKEEKREIRNEIFEFIKRCEFRQFEQIGFRFSLVSHEHPDVYSTFLALTSLKNIGLLKEYFASEGQSLVKEELKNYVLSLRKGNSFQHCHEKDCEICKKTSPARNLFYVMEIFTLLGIDIRNSRDQFSSLIGDSKRKSLSMVFRLLDLKYLDMDLEVKDKELQYFHQFQKPSGGFTLDQKESINDTFWVVYTLKEYSWLLDYNPSGVYLFINYKLEEILNNHEEWNTEQLSYYSRS